MQQLDAVAVELPAWVDNPGDIAAGVREAVGETSLDDIPSGDHDDRQCVRLSMHRQCIGYSGGDDDTRICCDQLDGGGFALLRIPAGDPALDGQIMSLDPPEPRRRLATSSGVRRVSKHARYRCSRFPDSRAGRAPVQQY